MGEELREPKHSLKDIGGFTGTTGKGFAHVVEYDALRPLNTELCKLWMRKGSKDVSIAHELLDTFNNSDERPPPKVPAWRKEDFTFCFNEVGNCKKQVSSREARKILFELGVSLQKSRARIPDGKYYTCYELLEELEEIQTHQRLEEGVLNSMTARDVMDNGHKTGYISEDYVIEMLTIQGLSHDEMFVLLAPYRRADGVLEIQQMMADFFPQEE